MKSGRGSCGDIGGHQHCRMGERRVYVTYEDDANIRGDTVLLSPGASAATDYKDIVVQTVAAEAWGQDNVSTGI